MNRERQLVHLAEAEAHVAPELRHIARQEEIIAAFERRGEIRVLADRCSRPFISRSACTNVTWL